MRCFMVNDPHPRAPRPMESPETADVVSRARGALEGVTEGPWRQNGNHSVYTPQWDCVALTYGDNKADAMFIAAARFLIPELIAEVERLRDLPEPAADRFWRLPLSMRMRLAADVLHEVNERYRSEHPRAGNSPNEPISESSMRWLADYWQRSGVS